MSSGKKKFPKKKTYSEGDMRRVKKQCFDDSVSRVMLLCIVAARDEFDLDDDGVMNFMNRMTRYIGYEAQGLIDMEVASKSLKERTGIDLRLSRW